MAITFDESAPVTGLQVLNMLAGRGVDIHVTTYGNRQWIFTVLRQDRFRVVEQEGAVTIRDGDGESFVLTTYRELEDLMRWIFEEFEE